MARSLTRWEPLAELGELRTQLDRVFGGLIGADGGWHPSIDIVRDNGNLVLRADLPGIKPDEVNIEVEEDILTVSGSHQQLSEEKGKHFLRRERHHGSFSRSMALPAGVKAEDIKASTSDGVVEVTIPLPKEEKTEPVRIIPTAA